jgi:hypothetical protein
VMTQPPGNLTVGDGFGLVVAAEDSTGTVDTTFDGNVTVVNPNGGAPLGCPACGSSLPVFSCCNLA